MNVSDTYDVLGDRRSWRLCGLEKSKRVMSILNLALCEKMKGKAAKGRGKMTKKKAARGLVVDVSQNPCRNKFTTKQGMNHPLHFYGASARREASPHHTEGDVV